MKKYLISIALLTLGMQAHASSRPWTFWYWMYGAVSKQAIKADLQAMKDVGLEGCYLMPIRGVGERPDYQGTAQQLTPTFWQMVDYAMEQSDSLQMQMGVHICDGFALAGGPWISPEESMQQVVWTDTIAHIDRRHSTFVLPQAHPGHLGFYRDIAAFAVRVASPLPKPHEGGTIKRDEKGVFRAKTPGFIEFSFDAPQQVRSIHIVPSGNNVQAQRLRIEASTDGVTYQLVRQLTPPRQGWQNTDQNYTYSLPATTARYFRCYWTPVGTEPGSEDLDAAKWAPTLKIRDIRLGADAVIDQYEAKNGSVWRIATNNSPSTDFPEVVMLDKDGSPRHPLGNGIWRIVRFGHTATGHTNATAGGGKGLECDKFTQKTVEKQIDSWFGQFMKRPHSNVVRYMHIDSWECGSQNWSASFADEFQRRCGYDLLPFLPVYAGIPMPGDDRVLRDIRTTIDHLINDVFFATAARKARQYGVSLSSESVAPTMISDGLTHYRYVDFPMGEFWLNSPTHDKPNDMLDAISGAHVYGKTIVQAEGFTEIRGVWNETPAMIKPLLDRNLALGMNRLFFHVNTHNPWMDRRPGMTLDGIGLFFQRDQTWFREAKGMVDYITRCQEWLQRGVPVVDIAVFTGDEMPSRSLTPDRLVPMLPGLFGTDRIADEARRLANEGQPMEESPVGVRHSAGIIDLKNWVNALHGYCYDSMNPDGLQNGRFDYKALVVPQGSFVSDASKRRIAELESQGVRIIRTPYCQDTLDVIGPDALLPEGVAFNHRRDGNTEIYFLANQLDSARTMTISLRTTKGVPHIYYPIDGKQEQPVFRHSNGRTELMLTLSAYGSAFVIFTDELQGNAPETTLQHHVLTTAPWDIHFHNNGVSLQQQPLADWTASSNDSIRYYSGRATYTTNFKIKVKKGQRYYLSLPDVRDVAQIWVNETDCGIVWTSPYEVDITNALHRGNNTLRIAVTNTWHNALRGADAGKAPFDGIWTNARYRTKGDSLLPAGLLAQPIIRITKATKQQ